jgi:hypothetical protein
MDYDGPSEGAGCNQGQGTMPAAMPGLGPRPEKARAVQAIQGQARVNRLSLADEARQSTLRERVYEACQRGEHQSRQYNRALRCAQLMEQHPEVAELVELLREF